MKSVWTLGAAMAAALISAPAFAQEQICGERDIIVSQLETKHGEFRRSVGLQDKGIVVEVFASDHGTWTILFTKPTGISCFMAVGKAWENDAPRDDVRAGTSL